MSVSWGGDVGPIPKWAVWIILAIALWFLFEETAAASDSSNSTGDSMTGNFQSPATWPTGDRIWDVCRAIAHAEGFDVKGTAPANLHNPGDLSPGDEHGYNTAGPAEFHGGSYIIHFASDQDGWGALYAKISNIYDGTSTVYDPDWSWVQIGETFAADPNWGAHVAAGLGVDPNSTLNQYLGGM